jgi:hypothetical protein
MNGFIALVEIDLSVRIQFDPVNEEWVEVCTFPHGSITNISDEVTVYKYCEEKIIKKGSFETFVFKFFA